MTDAYAGMGTELKAWEELTTDQERETILDFTDRFVKCPQIFVLQDPPARTTGIGLDLDISKGLYSKQLILRDVLVEVVRYHSVAPTFIPGAALGKKPVVVVEMYNRRVPLPWTFRAKYIANSDEQPLHEFEGKQVVVTRTDWETFLLKLEAKDRGIYEFNIDVILQQDDDPETTVRVTKKPLTVGFFSHPKETDPHYRFLHDRYIAKGGMLQAIVDEDNR